MATFLLWLHLTRSTMDPAWLKINPGVTGVSTTFLSVSPQIGTRFLQTKRGPIWIILILGLLIVFCIFHMGNPPFWESIVSFFYPKP